MPGALIGVVGWRRNPAELMLAGLCVLAAAAFFTGTASIPEPIERQMPGWLQVAWYASLAVAGAVGAVGNLWPGRYATAVRVRLSGQILAAGPAAAYTVATAVYVGRAAASASLVTGLWSGACLWAAALLVTDLRSVRAGYGR